MNETVSLRFTLLDMQIVDSEDRPVGRVDDVELSLALDGGPPRVSALLVGQQALGERLRSPLGGWLSSTAQRLRERASGRAPARIPLDAVAETRPMVKLDRPLRELPEVAPLERWLAHHVVAPLPGAGDAGE